MATRTSPVIPTGTWTVDPGQSSVEFSVRHMGIANVRGKFTEFEGTLEMQPDPEITFESTRVEAIDDESSRVHGNLQS